jgi:hypothetical protein
MKERRVAPKRFFFRSHQCRNWQLTSGGKPNNDDKPQHYGKSLIQHFAAKQARHFQFLI